MSEKFTSIQAEETKVKNKTKKYNVIACNCCHATGITLIKAIDSYYCKFCFEKLKKEKYKKEK